MSSINEITLLIQSVNQEIKKISEYYNKENNNEFKDALTIKVKHILEDLRSILDYTSDILYRKYCNEKSEIKVYFPYTKEHRTENDFIKYFKRNLPGIYENCNEIYEIIKKRQYFYKREIWMPFLFDLTNDVKHVKLNIVKEQLNKVIEFNNEIDGFVVMYDKDGTYIGNQKELKTYSASDGTFTKIGNEMASIKNEGNSNTLKLNVRVNSINRIVFNDTEKDVMFWLNKFANEIESLIEDIRLFIS